MDDYKSASAWLNYLWCVAMLDFECVETVLSELEDG